MSIIVEKDPSIYSKINGTDEYYPRTETIPSVFRRVVASYAYKAAISHGDNEFKYEDLYNKSSQVADILAKSGCRKGDFVGIYMERSPETIISILGILRAGGVYVPIDPDHPIERNRYIVENAGCKQLIVKDKYLESAASLSLALEGGSPISVEALFSGGRLVLRGCDYFSRRFSLCYLYLPVLPVTPKVRLSLTAE